MNQQKQPQDQQEQHYQPEPGHVMRREHYQQMARDAAQK